MLKQHKGHGFNRPVIPYTVKRNQNAAQILGRLEDISFQGRNLGTAFSVWKRALEDKAGIFFGLAGALTPAGLRRVIVHMIENRYIDVIVSTGANLFHDLHQSLGGMYFKCSPNHDDVALRNARMDRIYDVVGSDLEFIEVDQAVADFANGLERRPYSTREFFYLLGQHFSKQAKEDGVVTAAARCGVPIYVPAIGDSSFGIAMASWCKKDENGSGFQFDVLRDVEETARIAGTCKTTGIVMLGGGTPKNFIQQTWVTAEYLNIPNNGHKYCVQVTADAPHWGGLSGCTFEESTSWGKINFEARKVAVYTDATIALPLLVNGLADVKAEKLRKARPAFTLAERELKISMVAASKPAKKETGAKVS